MVEDDLAIWKNSLDDKIESFMRSNKELKIKHDAISAKLKKITAELVTIKIQTTNRNFPLIFLN